MLLSLLIVAIVLVAAILSALKLLHWHEPSPTRHIKLEEIHLKADGMRADEDYRHEQEKLNWEVIANVYRDEEEEVESRLKAAAPILPSKEALPAHKKFLVIEKIGWVAICAIDSLLFYFILEAYVFQDLVRLFLAPLLFVVFSSPLDIGLELTTSKFHKALNVAAFRMIFLGSVIGVIAVFGANILISLFRGQVFTYQFPTLFESIPQIQGLVNFATQILPAVFILISIGLSILAGIIQFDIRHRSSALKTATELYQGLQRVRRQIYEHSVARQREDHLHQLKRRKIDLLEQEMILKGTKFGGTPQSVYGKLKPLLPFLIVATSLVFLTLLGGCSQVDHSLDRVFQGEESATEYHCGLDATESNISRLPEAIRAAQELVEKQKEGDQVKAYLIHQSSESQARLLFSSTKPKRKGFLNVNFIRYKNETQKTFGALVDTIMRYKALAKRTDIIAFLHFVSGLPHDSTRRHVIVLCSDMIQDTPSWFTMEKPFKAEEALQRVRRLGKMCDLRLFELVVLGASDAGLKWDGYSEIKKFWLAYFSEAGVKRVILYAHDYSLINQLFHKED